MNCAAAGGIIVELLIERMSTFISHAITLNSSSGLRCPDSFKLPVAFMSPASPRLGF